MDRVVFLGGHGYDDSAEKCDCLQRMSDQGNLAMIMSFYGSFQWQYAEVRIIS